MNHWRYGCVKKTYTQKGNPEIDQDDFSETLYQLHEVYDQGKSWTQDPVTLAGSSKEELIKVLEMAIKDLKEYDVIDGDKE